MLDDPDGLDRLSEISPQLKRKRDLYDLLDDFNASERSESEVHETYKAVRDCRRAYGRGRGRYDQ